MNLTDKQIEHFMDKGWVKIKGAINRNLALRTQRYLWEILGVKFGITENQESWKLPLYQLSENYRHGVFSECSTSKLIDSIKDLVGVNRLDDNYEKDGIPFGWWPINVGQGSTEEWNVPVDGWHWDGLHFRPQVENPEQGLLMFVLFSDIKPRGGAALLAEGTHKLVVRFLAKYSKYLEHIAYEEALPLMNKSNPWLTELTGTGSYSDKYENGRIRKFMKQDYFDSSGTLLRVIECVGEAGDAFLIHPFIYRTGSQNHLREARIMCNYPVPLKEKINLKREGDRGYSVLEESIRRAIEL
ncbi:hypothetical protein DET54_11430 [Paenibacillus pabuli]|uniref:Uncharacterized protein n=1 Tax=Paenibacillus pabuli TaxID=1472 RepID=A0ABX9BEU4_9BACL|nr:hypothetical protein [Paenibacillus pabuli]RAI89562.1 hypothetical protein DET54_11430 [Paenibacillus pabuli]